MRATIPIILAAALCAALSVRADEIRLKDGTRIVGTIVGFEENSFKVKTNYGFAVVEKDQVASISMADAAKKAEQEKKSEAVAEKTEKPAVDKAASGAEANGGSGTPAKNAKGTNPAFASNGSSANANSHPVGKANPAPGSGASRADPNPSNAVAGNANAAAASTPPPDGVPENVREEVAGNTYTNDTYGFTMYKPPDWQVIDGARKLLPGTITAMGTDDQTTYLLIGQDVAGKSLASDLDTTEKRLRDVMDNFRPLGDKHITVSGGDAIERRFRGTVDQRDWSGIVVLIPRGTRLYTIFGMTAAETDLVQIQENVISRTIASLQFTK